LYEDQGVIKEVYLSMDNPLHMSPDFLDEAGRQKSPEQLVEWQKGIEEDYDGIIAEAHDGTTEYVVFSSDQILTKSEEEI